MTALDSSAGWLRSVYETASFLIAAILFVALVVAPAVFGFVALFFVARVYGLAAGAGAGLVVGLVSFVASVQINAWRKQIEVANR